MTRPPGLTPEMLRAGALVLRADFPNISEWFADTIAGEVFAAMIEAAPRKVDVQPPPVASLTTGQAFYYNLLWNVTDELRRYPTARELGDAAGKKRQTALFAIGQLRRKGFVKCNKQGKIRWLKPRN